MGTEAEQAIAEWLAVNGGAIKAMHSISSAEWAAAPIARQLSEVLYAVGRILDLLIERPDDGAALAYFASALKAELFWHSSYHPWFHEITHVRVTTGSAAAQVGVCETMWPGVMLGSLLLARQGVTVEASTELIDPRLAESSTLYWAHTRRGRPTADLSTGWGSNSQWATAFRRDYLTEKHAHFNVDARFRVPAAERGLSEQEAQDLVRNRMFLTQEVDREIWPWHTAVSERWT